MKNGSHAAAPQQLLPNRKFTWLAMGLGGCTLAYLAYRAYNSEKHLKLLNSLSSAASTVASISATASLIAQDLHAFLLSDNEELPHSLSQLNRLLQSQEVQATVASAAQALATGVSSSLSSSTSSDPHALPVVDRVLEAILSDRGRSLVGMAMGLATKNATSTLCEFIKAQQERAAASGSSQQPAMSSALASVMQLLSSEQGERLLSLLVTKSIKTAVSTYVESSTGYNTYEDFLSSISKQDHRTAVADIMSRVTASFCKEVASAYQRASSNSSSGTKKGVVGSTSTSSRPSPHHRPPPPSTLTPSSSLSSAASSSNSLCTHPHVQHAPLLPPMPTPGTQPLLQGGPTPHCKGNAVGDGGEDSPVEQQQQQQARASDGSLILAEGAHSSVSQVKVGDESGESGVQGTASVFGSHHHHQQQQQQQQHEDLEGADLPSTSANCNVDRHLRSAFAFGGSAQQLADVANPSLSFAPLGGGVQSHSYHHTHAHTHQQQHEAPGKASSPAKSPWVRRVVELVREKEVRALCLDVVTSATREATHSALEVITINVRASLPTYVQGVAVSAHHVAYAMLAMCLAFVVWCVAGRLGN